MVTHQEMLILITSGWKQNSACYTRISIRRASTNAASAPLRILRPLRETKFAFRERSIRVIGSIRSLNFVLQPQITRKFHRFSCVALLASLRTASELRFNEVYPCNPCHPWAKIKHPGGQTQIHSVREASVSSV